MRNLKLVITLPSVGSLVRSSVRGVVVFAFLMLYGCTLDAVADQILSVPLTDQAPVIDGMVEDAAWTSAGTIITRDQIAQIDIKLKAVRTDEEIFFLVSFPDDDESRQHKTLIWNQTNQQYDIGPKVEDIFVFKWSMEPFPVNLTLAAEEAYKADIWYWKAFRTDHANHADDKSQFFSDRHLPNSQPIINPNGNNYYLLRSGDVGQSAYNTVTPMDFQGDEIPGIQQRTPNGSRADVKAKGRWVNGFWNIEFSRRLSTGHFDDVQFDPMLEYRFGISRYEIAGRKPNRKLSDPAYGTGDIGEHLTLRFQ